MRYRPDEAQRETEAAARADAAKPEAPPVGAAITVVAKHKWGHEILLRATVTRHIEPPFDGGTGGFDWRCGTRTGSIFLRGRHELEWTYGHGLRARQAFQVLRALAQGVT